MTARKAALQALAAMAMALAATVVLAGSALAFEVTGADCYEVGDTVNILQADGQQGEKVFLTVAKDGRTLAKDYPETLGAEGSASDGSAFFITLSTADLNLDELDGSYTVAAYASRGDKAPLYEGAIYGVYADLPDGSSKLIGLRTVGKADAGRAFSAPESLFDNGASYKLDSEAKGEGALHYAYKEYDAVNSVDGVIKYVDMAGSLVTTTKIPGIAYGESEQVEIPSAVTDDANNIYRTVTSFNTVTAENPGQTSFTIQCVKMSDAAQAAANFYVATIQLVDDDGTVIAADSVNVTGEFLYTAPSEVYKTVSDGKGGSRVITYTIDGSPLVHLNAASDGVMNHARTITIKYTSEDPGAAATKVTFNLQDGNERVGSKARLLDTVEATVDADNPTAVPPMQIEANGKVYNLVGDPADYTYEFGSGATPVVDAFYLSEDYVAEGAYNVTVNYVNFVTGAVVGSQQVQSSPDDLGAITIETPESFSAEGVDYVRLDGQDASITHSYYSKNTTYTVYYRDVNDTLTSGTVINTIRVVYEGGTTTTTTGGAAAPAATTATTTEPATDAATTREAAEGADTLELMLNAGRTYNVLDGEGNNATLTNEEGVDSNTERIEDDETPLASGLEGVAGDTEGSVIEGVSNWELIVSGIAAVLAVLALVWWTTRRRKATNNGETA